MLYTNYDEEEQNNEAGDGTAEYMTPGDAKEWKEDRYRIIWFPARGKILGSMHKSSDYA